MLPLKNTRTHARTHTGLSGPKISSRQCSKRSDVKCIPSSALDVKSNDLILKPPLLLHSMLKQATHRYSFMLVFDCVGVGVEWCYLCVACEIQIAQDIVR